MKYPFFAENLKKALDKKGWKGINLCADLADNGVSVDMQSVNRWLAGVCLPRTNALVAVAFSLETSIDLLLEESTK